MLPQEEGRAQADTAAGGFATTHWSVVLSAGREASPSADAALEQLCRAYWYPLYAFVRRRGYGVEEAKDLTQDFFARLVGKNFLGAADRSRGRFRSFLLGAMRHFLSNEWDRVRSQKRGGQYEFVPWEEFTGEERYQREPAQDAAAETMFDRRWAMTVLETTMAKLKGDYAAAGKGALFDTLQALIVGEPPAGAYADLADHLKMNDGAVKVALHRLRRRYGELLRTEIAQTVAAPGEIDDEMRYLFSVVG